MWSIEDLVGDVRRLGADEGETVMVHASLRAIGPVVDRAEGVIAALDRVVGPQGTLLMTVGARDEFAGLNERPASERAALLGDLSPFDALTTPADPEVGVLAEVFRRHPGTRVSDHPEGRFAARGRLAEHLTVDPPWDDYYGPGSALDRLVQADGLILRLGADPDTVTLIHYAEHLADLPDKHRVLRHCKVLDGGVPVIKTVSSLDDSEGIVEYPGEDYFVEILLAFLETGKARIGQVGDAPSELFSARDMVDFAVEWMNLHLR